MTADNNDNYTPEVDAVENGDIDSLLAELLSSLGAPPPPAVPDDAFVATTTQLVETPDGELVPIEVTVRYPQGKLYEAAQSLASAASPVSLAAFLVGRALNDDDDRVIQGLSALGYSADSAEDRVYAIMDALLDLDAKQNPGFGESHDPYAPFRGSVDEVVDAATR